MSPCACRRLGVIDCHADRAQLIESFEIGETPGDRHAHPGQDRRCAQNRPGKVTDRPADRSTDLIVELVCHQTGIQIRVVDGEGDLDAIAIPLEVDGWRKAGIQQIDQARPLLNLGGKINKPIAWPLNFSRKYIEADGEAIEVLTNQISRG